MSLKLYFAPGSCAIAPLVALEEARASYEGVKLDLAAGEQRSESFLRVNPRGRVPALVVDGAPITENIAVLTYIAAAFPEAGLLPFEAPVELGRAYELMSWFASGIHVAIAQIWRTARFTPDETVHQALKDGGLATVRASFAELEGKMAGGWLVGDRFTVVDAYALVFWRWGERLGLDMRAGFPRWAEHTDKVLLRPAVQRALQREQQSSAG